VTPKRAHRTRLAVIGAVAVAALGLTACTGGESVAAAGDVNTVGEGISGGIDAAIESAMQLSHSTEAIVGVWDASGEYVRGYGEGVDAGTRFRSAQSAQPVVCALLLDAVEQGRVKLDDPVSNDLPRQSGIEDITYEQLCAQRSGLADFKGPIADIFVSNPTRPWPAQELIAQGLVNSPLSWPGLDFHQSDTNAVLLGRALAVEGASTLGDLVETQVFEPAGMRSSSHPATGTAISGDSLSARAFPSSGGAPVCDVEVLEIPEVSPSMLGGAGATVTTVTDLKNFYTAYFAGEFGGADVVTATQPTQNPERDEEGNPTSEIAEDSPQWAFGTEQVGPLLGRSGSITGTISAAYQDPSTGFTVIVALNNSSAGAGFARTLALQIAAIASAGGAGPELTWTAEDQAGRLAEAAICQ